jgi:hypothetical protein
MKTLTACGGVDDGSARQLDRQGKGAPPLNYAQVSNAPHCMLQLIDGCTVHCLLLMIKQARLQWRSLLKL